MSVLVDTNVWSEFLRRKEPDVSVRDELRRLVEEGDALLIGPIRQEILSGVRDEAQFLALQRILAEFEDEPLVSDDYVSAARMCNLCRSNGLQGSNTDFLVCAVGARLRAPIFTLDQDFARFANTLPVTLHFQ